MVVQRKPKSNTNDKAAEAFINGTDAPAKPVNAEPATASKKPVALRFNGDLLSKIDAAAKRKGISRNAWISFHCAEALENE